MRIARSTISITIDNDGADLELDVNSVIVSEERGCRLINIVLVEVGLKVTSSFIEVDRAGPFSDASLDLLFKLPPGNECIISLAPSFKSENFAASIKSITSEFNIKCSLHLDIFPVVLCDSCCIIGNPGRVNLWEGKIAVSSLADL
jgi:hypothetical protein